MDSDIPECCKRGGFPERRQRHTSIGSALFDPVALGRVQVPRCFEVHDVEPDSPFWIGLELKVGNPSGMPKVVSVVCRALDQNGVAFAEAPPFNVRRWVRRAMHGTRYALTQTADGAYDLSSPAVSSRSAREDVAIALGRRRRFIADEDLRLIAQSYRDAIAAGKHPVKEVMRVLRLDPHTQMDQADRRIGAARRRLDPLTGRPFLNPTTRGKKGEIVAPA